MWRYRVSDACFYLLMVLAFFGCGYLIHVTFDLHDFATSILAAIIVYAIHWLGDRATRGLI